MSSPSSSWPIPPPLLDTVSLDPDLVLQDIPFPLASSLPSWGFCLVGVLVDCNTELASGLVALSFEEPEDGYLCRALEQLQQGEQMGFYMKI